MYLYKPHTAESLWIGFQRFLFGTDFPEFQSNFTEFTRQTATLPPPPSRRSHSPQKKRKKKKTKKRPVENSCGRSTNSRCGRNLDGNSSGFAFPSTLVIYKKKRRKGTRPNFVTVCLLSSRNLSATGIACRVEWRLHLLVSIDGLASLYRVFTEFSSPFCGFRTSLSPLSPFIFRFSSNIYFSGFYQVLHGIYWRSRPFLWGPYWKSATTFQNIVQLLRNLLSLIQKYTVFFLAKFEWSVVCSFSSEVFRFSVPEMLPHLQFFSSYFYYFYFFTRVFKEFAYATSGPFSMKCHLIPPSLSFSSRPNVQPVVFRRLKNAKDVIRSFWAN